MILLLTALFSFASAQALETKELKKIFCSFQLKEARKHFDKDFLEHRGLEEVTSLIQEQRQQFGHCQELRALEAPAFELLYKEAVVPVDIVLNDDAKIKSVFFGMPRIKNDSIERVVAQIKQVPYRMSLYSGTESGKELLSFHSDDSLSISRSNQIFLLRATKSALAEQKLKLSDLVPLQEKAFVPAFGITHFWKPGTLISIDTLLNLLVAEKDLTASDLLLSRLDQSYFSRLAKSHLPFLSFREYFLLAKLPLKKLTGSPNAVAKLLPSLEGLPAPSEISLGRTDLVSHLGWFASTQELCASALAVKEEILALNSRLNNEYGSIQPKEIEKFGIVQVRDSGISQLTAVFSVKGQQEWRCLSLTANYEKEIEEGFFSSIAARVTNLLMERKTP